MDKGGNVLYQNSGMNAYGLGGVLGGAGSYGGAPNSTWANMGGGGMGVKPPGPRDQASSPWGYGNGQAWTDVNGATFNSVAPGTYGAGSGGGGGAPSAGGGLNFAGDIRGLLSQQNDEYNWARDQNVSNWNMNRNNLLGVQNSYDADPTNQMTRQRVNELLANPEALNDRTQNMIQNRAANSISSQMNAQNRQGMGVLGAAGQLDAGSILAMQERVGRGGMAEKQRVGTQLEIQRANQRNQDIQNAIATGQRQGQQDTGVRMGVANAIAEHTPQYQARDLSGMVAALAMQQAAARPTPPPAPTASPFGFNAGEQMWSFNNGAGGGVNFSDVYGDRLSQQGGATRPRGGSLQALGWDTTGVI